MAIIKAVNSKASIGKAVNYITKEEKTEEKLLYGKDCSPQSAIDEMKATKSLWEKEDGRQYKHYVQSFDPKDKITPEKAHKIGIEFIENERFKGHEVVMATHIDKGHIHNHFIVNSVNFENGKKFNESRKELKQLKELNNQICEREGISIVKEPFAKIRYTQAEKGLIENNQVSWKDQIRQSITHCKNQSENWNDFKTKMQELGFRMKEGKHVTYTHPDNPDWKSRDNKLGLDYERSTLENEFSRQVSTRENDTTSRTEHESENGIREHFTQGVTRAISDTERKVKGLMGEGNEEPNQSDRGENEEPSNLERTGQSELEKRQRELIEKARERLREFDHEL